VAKIRPETGDRLVPVLRPELRFPLTASFLQECVHGSNVTHRAAPRIKGGGEQVTLGLDSLPSGDASDLDRINERQTHRETGDVCLWEVGRRCFERDNRDQRQELPRHPGDNVLYLEVA
jgi:hypothetical protein